MKNNHLKKGFSTCLIYTAISTLMGSCGAIKLNSGPDIKGKQEAIDKKAEEARRAAEAARRTQTLGHEIV